MEILSLCPRPDADRFDTHRRGSGAGSDPRHLADVRDARRDARGIGRHFGFLFGFLILVAPLVGGGIFFLSRGRAEDVANERVAASASSICS